MKLYSERMRSRVYVVLNHVIDREIPYMDSVAQQRLQA